MTNVNFLRIEIKDNADKRIRDFFDSMFPEMIQEAKTMSLQEVALLLKKGTRDFIKSGGDGKWAVRSLIANAYTSSDKIPEKRIFRKKRGGLSKNADQGMLFLMRYYDWDIRKNTQGFDELFIDFRESSVEEINFLIGQVQEGATIDVSEKMRAAYTYTDFPLSPEKQKIVIPPRDVNPAYTKNRSKIFPTFEKTFVKMIREFVTIG